MKKQIKLEVDTMRKLQFVKNSLENIEIVEPYGCSIMRELIDCLDDIADDLQIDLPSAFDLGNVDNYKTIDGCE